MQHGAAQQRVDAPLLGVGCRRVPVKEGMRRRGGGTHRNGGDSRVCTKLDNTSNDGSFGHHVASDGLHATPTRPAGPRRRRSRRPPARDGAAVAGAARDLGCTPQSCAYRDSLAEFEQLGAAVVGISAQSPAEQAEFAAREHIPFPLLSDQDLQLAATLHLPTFEVEGMTLYKRLTLIAESRQIVKAFYPVFPPDRNAAEVLSWLRDDTVDPDSEAD